MKESLWGGVVDLSVVLWQLLNMRPWANAFRYFEHGFKWIIWQQYCFHVNAQQESCICGHNKRTNKQALFSKKKNQ